MFSQSIKQVQHYDNLVKNNLCMTFFRYIVLLGVYVRYGSYNANDVSVLSCITFPPKKEIRHLLDRNSCENASDICLLILFSGF